LVIRLLAIRLLVIGKLRGDVPFLPSCSQKVSNFQTVKDIMPQSMKKLILIFLSSVLIWSLAFCTSKTDVFQKHTYINRKGERLPYRLLTPQKTGKGKKYPLVIFFHGAGERGNDNESQLVNGVQLFSNPQNRKNFPCYMLVPQCPKGARWVETDWHLDSHIMPDTSSFPMRMCLALMDSIVKNNPIDTCRFYVTGVSMGGFATWDLIQRFPNKFAAAAPICGGADETKASLIKDVPVWAMHGGQDKVVKTIRSRHIIEALKAVGGRPNYTEFPALGHNAWDSAYHDDRVIKWMFGKRKYEIKNIGNSFKRQYLMNIDYNKCLENHFPCECEQLIKTYFAMTLDTNKGSKEYGIYLLKHHENEFEHYNIIKNNLGNFELYPHGVDSNKSIGYFELTDNKVYLFYKNNNKSVFALYKSSEKIDEYTYASMNIELLNKAFSKRKYPSLERIFNKDSLRCDCNYELGGVNLVWVHNSTTSWLFEHNGMSVFLYDYVNSNEDESYPPKVIKKLIKIYTW
jgi:predicted esterase